MKPIRHIFGFLLFLIILASACSRKDEKSYFERMAETESFPIKSSSLLISEREVGLDLLWVVDNSGSMYDKQLKLAQGFKAFAKKYLLDGHDVRIAVITTDTFLAGDPVLSDEQYGPHHGADFARLLPGIHDGPIPSVGKGKRSGRPILSTLQPATQLNQDFMTNIVPGKGGNNDERGMQSVVKFIDDNERQQDCTGSPRADSCFFRPHGVRGIIFVSDEDDASRFPGARTMDETVSEGKALLDQFFRELDQSPDWSSPNYFITSIASLEYNDFTVCSPTFCEGDTLLDDAGDSLIFNATPQQGVNCTAALCYWGKQYIGLNKAMRADPTNILAKYSDLENIQSANYDQILDNLGLRLQDASETARTGQRFQLKHEPTSLNDIRVSVVHADGSKEKLKGSIRLQGNELLVLGAKFDTMSESDKLEITYLRENK